MWADEELVGKVNFESIACYNADIDKTFFRFGRCILEEKEEILMKRMINKLVYSYSSSESLSLSEQSYFSMDKTKQTKKAYD